MVVKAGAEAVPTENSGFLFCSHLRLLFLILLFRRRFRFSPLGPRFGISFGFYFDALLFF